MGLLVPPIEGAPEMLAKATSLVASYDAMLLVATAIVGILTATVWTLVKRSNATAATPKQE